MGNRREPRRRLLLAPGERPHTVTEQLYSVSTAAVLVSMAADRHFVFCLLRFQCPADGEISEACFQSHPLEFARTTSAILYSNRTRVSIPLTTTRAGTVPAGSQWARNPVPGCYLCDAYKTCGPTLDPVSGLGDGPDKEDACFGPATGARCQVYNPYHS